MSLVNYIEFFIILILIIQLSTLIHEAGHLIGAKFMKMPVGTFSLGMGPEICSFKMKNVRIRIAPIPGGSVDLQVSSERFFELPLAPRIIYFLSGPCFNIAASIILLISLYLFGKTGTISSAGLLFSPGEWINKADSYYSWIIIAIQININFAVFNMLPCVYLDFGKTLFSIFDRHYPRLLKGYLIISLVLFVSIILISILGSGYFMYRLFFYA